jgi:uncharacterized protein (UPF0210 family)
MSSKTRIKVEDHIDKPIRTVTLEIDLRDWFEVEMNQADRNYYNLLSRRGNISDALFYYADIIAKMEEREESNRGLDNNNKT